MINTTLVALAATIGVFVGLVIIFAMEIADKYLNEKSKSDLEEEERARNP